MFFIIMYFIKAGTFEVVIISIMSNYKGNQKLAMSDSFKVYSLRKLIACFPYSVYLIFVPKPFELLEDVFNCDTVNMWICIH